MEIPKNGPETYDHWLAAISGARRRVHLDRVHLDNYIFKDDEVGEKFAEGLVRLPGRAPLLLAADAGCRCGGQGGQPAHAGRRDHRKLLAVDGEYASTGGVCISDGWLVTSPRRCFPTETRPSASAALPWPTVSGPSPNFGMSPGDLPQAERPDPGSITRSGEEAARVLVPATNDLPWIGAPSRTGYRQFLESGVRIFEYGGPMIHAKTVVADGWWSKVGSTNLNFASLVANWEIDLVAEDTGFAAQMEALFGGLGVLRAARSALSDRRSRASQDTDDS